MRSIYYESESDIAGKSLTCRLELPDDPIAVHGDSDYLQRAFQFVLDNAIKYTEAAGTITIHVISDETTVIVDITDTGIGIEQAELSRIFERFYQVDKAGTLRGFGLGLPIAKATIELHGGQIDVESTPGQGTTFRIALPHFQPSS